MNIQMVKLGNQGLEVPRVGLGCMGMSGIFGEADFEECRKTLDRAIELGVTHLDTSDIYGAQQVVPGEKGVGFGHNERLIGEILKGRLDKVCLATKFAARIDDTGKPDICGRPEYVAEACDASLERLRADVIDLYYYHRKDPRVPIEDTIGAMADLVTQGKVRYIGISEMALDTMRRAYNTFPISAVQAEYSLWTRQHEEGILPLCRELNIGLVAFSPLGRAMLTGSIDENTDFEKGDYRSALPRFKDDALKQNLKLVEALGAFAEKKGCTTAQVALAWVMARGDFIATIAGTKRVKYIEQNAAADKVELSSSEVEELATLFDPNNVVGARYNPKTEEMARTE